MFLFCFDRNRDTVFFSFFFFRVIRKLELNVLFLLFSLDRNNEHNETIGRLRRAGVHGQGPGRRRRDSGIVQGSEERGRVLLPEGRHCEGVLQYNVVHIVQSLGRSVGLYVYFKYMSI